MTPGRSVALSPALGAATLGLAATLALAASPGWLSADLGATVHGGFRWLCHQLPDRSFHTHGVPWALCHRCVGILGGVLFGLVAAPVLGRSVVVRLDRARPGRLLVASLIPLAFDWTLTAVGLWANTPISRTLTGAFFGVAAGVVLALAMRPAAHPHSSSSNLLAS